LKSQEEKANRQAVNAVLKSLFVLMPIKAF